MEYNTDIYAIADCPQMMGLEEGQKNALKECIQQDECATARGNLAGTQVVIKWSNGDPNPLIPLGITHTTYTHEQILVEMAKADWGINVF